MSHNDDEFVSYVEFENEDGDTLTMEVLDYFTYEDTLYAILTNADTYDEESDDFEVCVLKVTETEDGQIFEEPDESKIADLQAIVEKIFEEADCECDDDDCGCSHHHYHHDGCCCDDDDDGIM